MKKSIFLYLFVFAALINLYQFVSARSYVKETDNRLESCYEGKRKYQDSVQSLLLKTLDLQYFDLDHNDDALAYYENLDMEYPSHYITDKLMETNEAPGNNPLVPYEGMSGSPMKLNKVKVLNHRWIIADFSDGKYWGEVLIAYYLNEDMSVDFERLAQILYSGQ